ncbi:uroporphyrinogen-III synthase [Yoonia sp.]|uniref:uroporphyrinogen-III synthase n=1 Tax=Yoonia sp. TaxID=2212373 RepID=UPI0023842D31|nr:uroporphyrinogen-III synthase [Yoonia sp.]MDE0850875.1 uroporphyrinogen-III synthase [Yoonia sp.]
MTATVLITRPKAQSEAFAAALEVAYEGPVRTVISPLLEIVPLAVSGSYQNVDHVIFTSVHGVAAAARLGLQKGIAAWCVGTQTANAAADMGFAVHNADGANRELVAMIVAAAPKGRMIHVRGKYVAGAIVEHLRSSGIVCDVVVAYEQMACPATSAARSLLRGQNSVIVPLFSPRTAKLFAEIADFNAPLHLITMSEAVDVSNEDAPIASRKIATNNRRAGMITETLSQYAHFSP